MATKWIEAALDMVFPRACAACGGPLEGGRDRLCWDCRADIRPISHPFCSVCGNPVEGRIHHDYICYLCAEASRHFTRARSAARFEGVLQKVIHDFKYNEALWLESELVDVLETCHAVHYADVPLGGVTSVPLFHARQRERGYNQAEILARGLAARLHKPFYRGILCRIRRTETQTHLTARQRAANVSGAFRAGRSRRIAGRSILLVDDVMTTGATLSECAKVLRESGAGDVYVLTVARGG
jgi:ComF family protein